MRLLGGRLAIGFSAAVFAIGVLTSCGMLVARTLDNGKTGTTRPQASAAPQLSEITLSAPTFNPAFDSLILTASLSQPAEIEADVVPAQGGVAVRSFLPTPADGQVRVRWDGNDDHGRPVSAGNYRLELHAIGDSGQQAAVSSDPVAVSNKYILVSESQQALYAYDGATLFLRTPVTTGGPELPTPTGTFHILDKTRDLYVYSPWPKGSPYWFPDVTYQYALDFYENSQYGLYIHDASWRNNYGPGSNAVDGTPGEDDTGTHGCINVPLVEQQQLYPWAPVGTPVVVRS